VFHSLHCSFLPGLDVALNSINIRFVPPFVFRFNEDSSLLVGSLILSFFKLLDIFLPECMVKHDRSGVVGLEVSVGSQALQKRVLMYFSDRALINLGLGNADSLQLSLINLLELVNDKRSSASIVIVRPNNFGHHRLLKLFLHFAHFWQRSSFLRRFGCLRPRMRNFLFSLRSATIRLLGRLHSGCLRLDHLPLFRSSLSGGKQLLTLLELGLLLGFLSLRAFLMERDLSVLLGFELEIFVLELLIAVLLVHHVCMLEGLKLGRLLVVGAGVRFEGLYAFCVRLHN
jgi:hypothetical protein